MYLAIAFVLFTWLLCGLIHIGYSFAYWQRKFVLLRRREFSSDRRFVTGLALLGPCALIATLWGYTDYGWLWPWGAKAKREAGIE